MKNRNSLRRSFNLLRGKVKVEAGLKSVKVELARGEEPPGGGGGGPGKEGGLDGLLGLGLGAGTGQVTGQKTSLVVGVVEGVDEGVDAGAVGAVGHGGGGPLAGGVVLGGEVGAVGVEPEVAVGGVVGVDEGVEVGVDGGIVVDDVIVERGSLGLGGLGLGLQEGGGGGSYRGNNGGRGGKVSVEGGRVETVGAGGDVVALHAESVLAGGPLDADGLARVVDVAVLAGPLTLVVDGLLPGHDSVLLGVGRAELAGAGVEALLLEDLGVLGVDELAAGGGGEAGGDNLEIDDRYII